MKKSRIRRLLLSSIALFSCIGLGFTVVPGCKARPSAEDKDAPEIANANVIRGGALYDKFWAVAKTPQPEGDHPLWAKRPDTESNKRSDSATWRCKECHGWDYKGSSGAYGSGSHLTGIRGIAGTRLSAEDIFTMLKSPTTTSVQGIAGHQYGSVLDDAEIWNVVKFVLEGKVDTSAIVDADKAFTGDATKGKRLYIFGIGTLTACAICHGEKGLDNPSEDGADFSAWVGKIAKANPWEFQHKVRFGQPGTAMKGWHGSCGSIQDIAVLGAFAQTLPEKP